MKVLALTYWSFREPLVQAATLPYLKMIREELPEGSEIILLTLEKEHLRLSDEERIHADEQLARHGIKLKMFRYVPFGLGAMVRWLVQLIHLYFFCKKEKIKTLHVFASPIGTAGYIISRLTGIPLVIDSFEPHSESMVENGSWRKGSLAHRMLFHYERKQARHARAVIATTEGMQSYAREKYQVIPRHFMVKPACVDLAAFSHESATPPSDLENLEGKIVCVYAGKIGGIYLEDEIFEFFATCREKWGDQFRALLLSDTPEIKVRTLCKKADLPFDSVILRQVLHDEVPGYLALASFALNPVKPVPSKRYCTSIKDGEYWAMGLPVVIPENISDDSEIIEEAQIGAVLKGLTKDDYRSALESIEVLMHDDSISDRIRQIAERERSMEIARRAYRRLYGEGIAFGKETNYLVIIYNSYGDPLYQNLVHQYILEQASRHPLYHFDLITFEQKKYALTRKQEKMEQVELKSRGIRWRPLTYHSGNFLVLKKGVDFLNALLQSFAIRIRKKPKMMIAFANASAALTVVLSRLLGVPMMVYSYEPHSQFLAEFGIWRKNSLRYRLLNSLEEMAGRRSQYILTGTRHMVKELEGQVKGKVLRAPSAVDPEVFCFKPKERDRIRQELGWEDRRIMIYVGKFGGLYYDQEILDFCSGIKSEDSNWSFVFLTPDDKKSLGARLEKSLGDSFYLGEAKSPEEVASWLSAADFGINAIPPYPAQKFRSPVKVGEYLLCGLPYITCAGISEDDEWALSTNTGVVVDEISSASARGALDDITNIFKSEGLRERCRSAGLEYRSISRVHDAFEQALRNKVT